MQPLKFAERETDPFAEFYPTLKRRVDTYMRICGISPGPNVAFWVKAFFWAALAYGSYAWILSDELRGGPLLLAVCVFGVAALLLGFAVGHDAAHRAITRRPWLDEVLHFFAFAQIGIDYQLWGLRHVRSHHVYGNVYESDQDIERNPFLRLSPDHPWHRRFRWQAFYAPFVYALALLHSVFVGDWIYLFHRDYAWMRRGVPKGKLYGVFALNKLVHFTLNLGLPLTFLSIPWWQVVIGYLIVSALQSWLFIWFLVGTHFFEEAAFPAPEAGRLPHNWAAHQLLTSCDWNPDSRLSNFLSGGACAHSCHHLFPHLCHVHYARINPILKKTAAEFGLPYHRKTLRAMTASHFRFLHQLGQNRAGAPDASPTGQDQRPAEQ